MKLSLLTPAFNEEAHVAEFIESAIGQEFTNWELLVIDDGSTDRTAEIVTEYCNKDSRIRLISCGNKVGKVQAFNQLFSKSSGDIVMIPGADDILPQGSLGLRVGQFANVQLGIKAIAYFKIRSFSEDPKFDGLTLPKGLAPSRSGPSITMNRELADVLFPIDESLPAEDVWLSRAADALADEIIQSHEIGMYYRIHSGNSNPRHKTFPKMNESLHARQLVFAKLLDCDRFQLSEQDRKELEERARVEELRYSGKTITILATSKLPMMDTLGIAASSDPRLFSLRKRFYRQLTGLRGR